MQKHHYIFILLLFYTLVYLAPLGVRPLVAPDESRYAEVPREMVASGDWVVPQLNGLKYYEKPVMGYWVHALSQKVFGQSNFAVRLPCAASIGLVGLLIYTLLATTLGKEDSRVYLAPLIFLSSLGMFGIGTITVLDNVLNFFLTASVVSFYLASEKQSRSSGEKALLLMAGIFVGCAFMTKGFLAFVVPIISVIPYLLWQRRGKEIIRMLCWPAVSAVLVSLPWSIMIHLRDPEFWNFFFWHEHVKRFFSDNAQHHESFWYYFLFIIPLFLPWIFLIPAAFSGLFNESNRGEKLVRLIGLCVCWFVFPFLFFSISNGKLATYILPCFAPLAILTAIGLYGSIKGSRKFLGLGISIFTFLATVGLLAIIGTQILGSDLIPMPESTWKYSADSLRYSDTLWKPTLIVSSLAFMVVLCFMALRCKHGEKKLVLLALSPVLLMIASCIALPDLTLVVKAPGIFLEKNIKSIPDNAIVISDPETVAAACWYLKRSDLFLFKGRGELKYGLARPDGKFRFLKYAEIQQLIDSKKERPIVLILKTKNWERNRLKFSEPHELSSSGRYGHSIVKYEPFSKSAKN